MKDLIVKFYNKFVELISINLKVVGFYYGKLLVVDKIVIIFGEDWLYFKDR